MELSKTWSYTKSLLREQFPRHEFDTWVRHTTLIALNDQGATLEVPNTATQNWITRHQFRIARTMGNAVGKPISRLVVQIAGAASPSLAADPDGPPHGHADAEATTESLADPHPSACPDVGDEHCAAAEALPVASPDVGGERRAAAALPVACPEAGDERSTAAEALPVASPEAGGERRAAAALPVVCPEAGSERSATAAALPVACPDAGDERGAAAAPRDVQRKLALIWSGVLEQMKPKVLKDTFALYLFGTTLHSCTEGEAIILVTSQAQWAWMQHPDTMRQVRRALSNECGHLIQSVRVVCRDEDVQS